MKCFSYSELVQKGLKIQYSLTTSRMNGGRDMEDELILISAVNCEKCGIKITGYPARVFEECHTTWWDLRDLYVPNEDRL